MDKPTAILSGALDQYRIQENQKSTAKGELGQQQFFDLMITQLQNQDPFKPMESGDFLGQIAQFSTVNGIGELKASFESMASSLQSSQALQASTMVGRAVVVPSNSFKLTPGQDTVLSTEIPAAASNVRVTISDSLGQVVAQAQLGRQDAGRLNFVWNGLRGDGQVAPAGTYSMRFDASINGAQQALDTAVAARVDSVTLARDGSQPTLNVDGFGTVAMSDVLEIL